MKKSIFILLLLIASFISKAQTGPETMLKSFYTAYMSSFSNPGQSLKSLRQQYCTLKCQRQFSRLATATDGDPLIKAQDSDAGLAKSLTVSKNTSRPNVYTVSYKTPAYDNAGKAHEDIITIKLLVIEQNGIYKIDSIL